LLRARCVVAPIHARTLPSDSPNAHPPPLRWSPYRRGYPAGDQAGRRGGLPSYPPQLSLHATPETPGSRGPRWCLLQADTPWQPSPVEKRLGAPDALLAEGSDVTTLHVGSLALRPAGWRRPPRGLRRTASRRQVAPPPRVPRYRAEQAIARAGLSPASYGSSSAHSRLTRLPSPSLTATRPAANARTGSARVWQCPPGTFWLACGDSAAACISAWPNE
jgi:hypothetical protein